MGIKNNRKQFLFGTWKNKLSLIESINLFNSVKAEIKRDPNKIIGICPSYMSLPTISALSNGIPIGAQNCGWADSYSLTGEVNVKDLTLLGARYCIVGHSERRIHLNETEEIIRKRLTELLKNNITPILCVGEQMQEKEVGKLYEVINRQVDSLIASFLDAKINCEPDTFIIAYEPMWAISTSGSGKSLGEQEAEEIHSAIRNIIGIKLGNEVQKKVSIIYGGSLSPKNADAFFSKDNIDGGLVGSATQSERSFIELIHAFYK